MATDETLPYYLKNKLGKIPENDEQFLVFSGEHLDYEVWMLCEAYRRLVAARREPKTLVRTITINLAVEAIAMHARLLHEFFDEDSTHREDAKASDLEGGSVPAERKGLRSEGGSAAKKTGFDVDRANREIVHFSYERFYGEPRQKAWDLSYLPALANMIDEFLGRVPDARISADTKAAIRQALADAKFEPAKLKVRKEKVAAEEPTFTTPSTNDLYGGPFDVAPGTANRSIFKEGKP